MASKRRNSPPTMTHQDVVWRNFMLKAWYNTSHTVNLSNHGDRHRHDEPSISLKVDFKEGKPHKYTARITEKNIESSSYDMDSAEEALEDARVRVAMLASALISKAGDHGAEQAKSLEGPLGE